MAEEKFINEHVYNRVMSTEHAKVRVSIKRNLTRKGIRFNKEMSTYELNELDRGY
jgi:hypothetical protein